MGYTTEFSGSFSINPPLTKEHADELLAFSNERHNDKFCPGIWCDWIPTNCGATLEWSGAEKFYNYTEWLIHLVDHFFKLNGYKIAGQVAWQGEDASDSGVIYAMDNRIEAIKNEVTNPGPSWGN